LNDGQSAPAWHFSGSQINKPPHRKRGG
jgi:hypothetical protein